MNIKKITISAATLLTLIPSIGIVVSSSVNASTTQTTTQEQNKNLELKKQFDPYISVENNQFVLQVPESIKVNINNQNKVQEQLTTLNQYISAHNAIIDPNTKEIIYKTVSLRASGYTQANFWWGTRYYFRSNAAVYKMDHDLDNYTIMTGLTGLWAAPIAALGAAYYQKVKSDLDYFNNTHLKNYINMDVEWTGVYRIYVA